MSGPGTAVATMADLLVQVPTVVDSPDAPARWATLVPSLQLYCPGHRALHVLPVADVEVLVHTLGLMVVDGFKLGDDEHRHSPDCLLDVILIGRDVEGYAEFTEQAVEAREQGPDSERSVVGEDRRAAQFFGAKPTIEDKVQLMDTLAGEHLDAERRGHPIEAAECTPERPCRQCTTSPIDTKCRCGKWPGLSEVHEQGTAGCAFDGRGRLR